ncbi:hypothetical protein K438DRAFT_1997585 [Mycena galopus ATCC 62051]|nr:hypothetical protein K438DRAFT_1997585 [Mycena galopus ATCC 62051]
MTSAYRCLPPFHPDPGAWAQAPAFYLISSPTALDNCGVYTSWRHQRPGIGGGAARALSQEAHKEDLQKLPQGWLVNVTQTSASNPKETRSRFLHAWITNVTINEHEDNFASSYRPAIPSSLPVALEYHPSHPVILSAHSSGAAVYLLRCTG